MDFLFAGVWVLYLPMLPYTLAFFAVVGTAVSLYKHNGKPLLYSLLMSLPANIVVVLVYLTNFAQFG